MVERSRYLNINLFFNVQSLLLPSAILQGCQINICKQLCNQDEERKAKSIMNFSKDEQTNAMMGLKPFDAIYIDKKRTDIPIHILLPNYLTQLVTDEMMNHAQDDITKKILDGVMHEKPVRTKVDIEKELSPDEDKIMKFLQKEGLAVTQRRIANEFNINVATVNMMLKRLAEKKFLNQFPQPLNLGPGGRLVIYTFTEISEKIYGKPSVTHIAVVVTYSIRQQLH